MGFPLLLCCSGFTALAVLIIVKFLRFRLSIFGKLAVAPSEEWNFWWGHEYAIASNEVSVKYSEWEDRLGPVYRIKAALFQKDKLIVADHAAARHILDNAYTYTKSPAYQDLIVKVAGRGVVWAEADEHRFQRRMITPAFTASAVRGMADGIFECVQNTASRMLSDIEYTGGGVLNLSAYIPACTLEIIGRVGFGYDLSYNTPEATAILNGWQEDVAKFRSFAAFLAPIVIGIFPWISQLPIRELHEDGTAKKVIYQVGRRLLEQPVNPGSKDIFSILVKESWAGSEKDSSTRKLSDSQLIDNILTFVMAGFETGAGVAELTLLNLARNPEAQRKLREELMSSEFTPDTVDKFPYLDAVTREGLRLHPTSQDLHRVARTDDILPLHKPITLSDGRVITSIPVKAGDSFTVPLTAMNTNPAVWGPDGREFVPERWLKPEGVPTSKDLPHGPFSSVTSFSDGPRLCAGWRLATLELKTILAFMIINFEFKDIGVGVRKFLSPTVQPFVDNQAAMLPVYVTPVQGTE